MVANSCDPLYRSRKRACVPRGGNFYIKTHRHRPESYTNDEIYKTLMAPGIIRYSAILGSVTIAGSLFLYTVYPIRATTLISASFSNSKFRDPIYRKRSKNKLQFLADTSIENFIFFNTIEVIPYLALFLKLYTYLYSYTSLQIYL